MLRAKRALPPSALLGLLVTICWSCRPPLPISQCSPSEECPPGYRCTDQGYCVANPTDQGSMDSAGAGDQGIVEPDRGGSRDRRPPRDMGATDGENTPDHPTGRDRWLEAGVLEDTPAADRAVDDLQLLADLAPTTDGGAPDTDAPDTDAAVTDIATPDITTATDLAAPDTPGPADSAPPDSASPSDLAAADISAALDHVGLDGAAPPDATFLMDRGRLDLQVVFLDGTWPELVVIGLDAHLTDSCWLDQSTGLLWVNPDTYTQIPQTHLSTTCQKITACDHSDWRAPTIAELRSLIRGCSTSETDGTCSALYEDCYTTACADVASCPDCTPGEGTGDNGYYWEAELVSPPGSSPHLWWSTTKIGSTGYAWGIDFRSASIKYGRVTDTEYFRCVRGP